MQRKQAHDGPIEMFVVYNSPRDLPCLFVARRFEGDQPTDEFAIGLTLEAVRAELPEGLIRLERFPQDEPQIVETWF